MSKSYFSHDADAHHNSRLIIIINRYGIAGYGMFWVIVERMRSSNNYKLILSDIEIEALSSICRANAEQMLEFVNACIGLGLFIKEGNEFYSPSLMGRMKTMDEIKNKRKEAALAGVAKRKLSNENNDNSANAEQVLANAEQNPANKIKLNKIKLKEIKEKAKQPPLLSVEYDERFKEIFALLGSIPNYPLDEAKDYAAITELEGEFPERETTGVLRNFKTFLEGKPLTKKSNARLALRNAFEFCQKYDKYRKVVPAVDKPLVLDEYQLALKERLLKEREQREKDKRERLEQEKLQEGI